MNNIPKIYFDKIDENKTSDKFSNVRLITTSIFSFYWNYSELKTNYHYQNNPFIHEYNKETVKTYRNYTSI